MKRNSILETRNPEPVPTSAAEGGAQAGLLRFPAEDDGRSLTNMAQRDLDAALQLLAQRAQYISGASGAAVALREESGMICRASAGTSAPPLGSHLQTDSGLSGESVRTRQILRCDNAETDSRVNRETCQALGIASVIVMPLLQNEDVIGVFELFSERVSAFEERDVVALQRIAEMILTAVEHVSAAKRTELELKAEPEVEPVVVPSGGEVKAEAATPATVEPQPQEDSKIEAIPTVKPVPHQAEMMTKPEPAPSQVDEDDEPLFAVVSFQAGKIGKCSSCGFPVSEGRDLCLDCESAKREASSAGGTGDFLAGFEHADQGWFASNKYVIVALILAAVLLISVALRFR